MVRWQGDQVRAKVLDAAKYAVDRVMAETVVYAKNNHPGFNNVTGFAEGSIQVAKFATVQANRVAGQWGSVGCDYFIWLELKRGSPLRTAASVVYPRLEEYMKARLAQQ